MVEEKGKKNEANFFFSYFQTVVLWSFMPPLTTESTKMVENVELTFLQIYEKYISMWHYLYRTSTEHRQKTSDFFKGHENLHITG